MIGLLRQQVKDPAFVRNASVHMPIDKPLAKKAIK
jgi:hypothetical protein